MASKRPEDYYYPGTNVLKNNLGIQNQDDLSFAERKLSNIRRMELDDLEPASGFDFDRLKDTHSYLFQDVYDWAGQQRDVDIAKGNSFFCKSMFVDPAAQDIFSRLNQENELRGLDKDAYIDRLSEYMGDVNNLHPFMEGNGRTQRQFFKDLSQEAGHSLDFDGIDKQQLIEADIAAMHGNGKPLKSALNQMVDRPQAIKITPDQLVADHDKIERQLAQAQKSHKELTRESDQLRDQIADLQNRDRIISQYATKLQELRGHNQAQGVAQQIANFEKDHGLAVSALKTDYGIEPSQIGPKVAEMTGRQNEIQSEIGKLPDIGKFQEQQKQIGEQLAAQKEKSQEKPVEKAKENQIEKSPEPEKPAPTPQPDKKVVQDQSQAPVAGESKPQSTDVGENKKKSQGQSMGI